jgi:hypothetical protein
MVENSSNTDWRTKRKHSSCVAPVSTPPSICCTVSLNVLSKWVHASTQEHLLLYGSVCAHPEGWPCTISNTTAESVSAHKPCCSLHSSLPGLVDTSDLLSWGQCCPCPERLEGSHQPCCQVCLRRAATYSQSLSGTDLGISGAAREGKQKRRGVSFPFSFVSFFFWEGVLLCLKRSSCFSVASMGPTGAHHCSGPYSFAL